jgi:DNA topoisomerase-1
MTNYALTSPEAAQDFAAAEGLRYITDSQPGFTREKRGNDFVYLDKAGKRITDDKVITRIKAIGIPPAYTDVWISPFANGHIQATGKDARGRKQYRYHTTWRQVRDETKFQHILDFADALPAIRKTVKQHLALSGLPREKVLATVISLMEKTAIRVGNAEYAKDNNSYGLTTMRRKHVKLSGDTIKFEFTGKSGKTWNLAVRDRRIARIVKQCADIPGYELFKYVADDGTKTDVTSADVNSYLRDISGGYFTAKDFRTWSGTLLAALALQEFEKYDSAAQAKKNVVAAIDRVAKQLGNTPAICRKCYVHPEVLNAYLDDALDPPFTELIRQRIDAKLKTKYQEFNDDELMVLAFLKKRLH